MFDLSKSTLAAGVAALALTATATAQESAPAVNNGAVSFSLGADIPTKYIFRGYEIEEDGLIVQPYLEASFAIGDGVDFYLGTWHSFEETNGGVTESDYYAGVSFSAFDPLSFDISLVHYNYPQSDSDLGDYNELNIAVAYDDSNLWGSDFSIAPYALLAIEFDTETPGDDDNIYLELGGETGFTLFESEDYAIDLTVPVAVGLSLDEFYVDDEGDNEFFGYVSIGANVGMPLNFIPSEFGTWSAGAGVTFFILNDNAVGLDDGSNEEFNLVGTVGIAMEY